MTMNTTPKRTFIYTRISNDREGRELGVRRQETDCRARAERDGMQVIEMFCDNDRGASTRSRKRREEYARMLAAVENGEADAILAYSNSRLTRRPMELEGLIQLHDRTGVKILTIVSGDDDLSAADGRIIARIKAAVDAGEAERTAERVKRAMADNAATGRHHGGKRPFGWASDRMTLDSTEAGVLVEIADRLLAGESLYSIAAGLNDGPVRPVYGGRWVPSNIQKMMLSPRLAGLRVHHGQIAAAGKWEPVLDEITWRQLVRLLRDPRRRVTSGTNRKQLLSGLALCGECDVPISTRYNGRINYHCRGCKLWRIQAPIDAYVEGATIAFLELVDDEPDPTVHLGQEEKVERIRGRIANTLAEFAESDDMTEQQLRGLVRDLNQRLAVEEAKLIPSSGPRLRRGMIGPEAAERWAGLSADQKRAHIADVWEIRIMRASGGAGGFSEDSVQLRLRH